MKYAAFITAKSLHNRDILSKYVLLLFIRSMILGQDIEILLFPLHLFNVFLIKCLFCKTIVNRFRSNTISNN